MVQARLFQSSPLLGSVGTGANVGTLGIDSNASAETLRSGGRLIDSVINSLSIVDREHGLPEERDSKGFECELVVGDACSRQKSELRNAGTAVKDTIDDLGVGTANTPGRSFSLQPRHAADALKAELASTLASMSALWAELAILSNSRVSSASQFSLPVTQHSTVGSPSHNVHHLLPTSLTAAAALLRVAELEGNVRAARLEGQLKEQRWAAAVSTAQVGAALRAVGVKQHAMRTGESGESGSGRNVSLSMRTRNGLQEGIPILHERPTNYRRIYKNKLEKNHL
jgi:hypothetical protein